MKFLSSIILLAAVFSSNFQFNEAVCGYEACPVPKDNMINVHLVPHSHDDVGWLKTVDQYYYGSENNIQHAGVQYIIDNVVSELLKDSKRRFIQVETAFFFKWYDEQNDLVKAGVQKLVNEGRLEFIGGAWSMNDEAAVHYQSVIDQFSLGLKALNNTFGDCARPRVGWQIDPFGHSREMASIFAQMGYSGEFFARMDWVDKSTRLGKQEIEMIWDASESLGESSELFTGLLYRHYSAPPGFCFDLLCGDAPIIDAKSYDNNVNDRVNAFIEYIENMSKSFRATHVMVPMGDDFQYENAEQNFKNMDKLIKYVNERQSVGSHINLMYSTPSCYLNELHKLNQTWPNKTQDFFPYSSDQHSYWTGYFTSRPTQKRFERDGNHFLQVVKQLSTLAKLSTEQQEEDLNYLRQIMGVMQHHDAITGTEKQKVAHDYDRLLDDAIKGAQHNARDALRQLTGLKDGEFESCLLANISYCAITSDDANNLIVTLYNPLAHVSTQYVRVPVKEANYVVRSDREGIVSSELVPVPWQVLDIEYRDNKTQHELVFLATVEKYDSYYITQAPTPRQVDEKDNGVNVPDRFKKVHNFNSAAKKGSRSHIMPRDEEEDLIVKNSNVKLTFHGGFLKNVEMNGISENIEQYFGIYEGFKGDNSQNEKRSSGAYIFRPDGDIHILNDPISYSYYDGKNVKEVHQTINDWISQVIRIYEGESRVEFEWLVGPIPVEDEVGKEIITRFQSDIASNDVFYTDSNGREMIRRVRNKRENFEPHLEETVSSNYYPVTARIALEDDKKRIALLNDRAQGGSSLESGSLELMLHRRLLKDDAFGVGEALNEQPYGKGLIARGKVQLVLHPVAKKSTVGERELQQQIHLPFWKFFSKAIPSGADVPYNIPDFDSFPKSVHLLTLEPYSKNEVLLRVEHFLDHTEGSVVSFNIRDIFDSLDGVAIRETTLDGNLELNKMKRFKFHHDGTIPTNVDYLTSSHTPISAALQDEVSLFSVTLIPMQIRTFIIEQRSTHD